MDLIFNSPRYLYFLVFIPIIIITHYLVLRLTKKQAIPFANYQTLSRISAKYMFIQNNVQLIVRIMIMILLCFSLAGAELHYVLSDSSASTVILLDASESMFVTVDGISAFDLSRNFLNIYGTNHNYASTLSLITYSTVSKMELTPTQSLSDALSVFNVVSGHNIGGSDLGSALINSLFLINTQKGSKRILVITDGKTSFGTLMEQALQEALKSNVVIDVLLLNVDGHIPLRDTLGRLVESNRGTLYEIDEISNDAVKKVVNLERSIVVLDLRQILLLAALVMLTLEWAMSKSIFKTIPE